MTKMKWKPLGRGARVPLLRRAWETSTLPATSANSLATPGDGNLRAKIMFIAAAGLLIPPSLLVYGVVALSTGGSGRAV